MKLHKIRQIKKIKGRAFMKKGSGNKAGHREPTVAPGYNDRKFGEKATEKDIKAGKSTRVTRVYLDENDPS